MAYKVPTGEIVGIDADGTHVDTLFGFAARKFQTGTIVTQRQASALWARIIDMTPDDHTLIAKTATQMAGTLAGVVVVHGTDRLAVSGERMCELGKPASPIVLTGAMRPYELRSTDALQNLTEALLAVQLLAPGVYVAMHNQVLQFPGVIKDPQRGTFVRTKQ